MNRSNFYYKEVENHPLKNKVCDFDWRSPKEKSQPYDSSNKNVDQKVFVEWVGENCEGKLFAFLKDRQMNVSLDRLCKVHH